MKYTTMVLLLFGVLLCALIAFVGCKNVAGVGIDVLEDAASSSDDLLSHTTDSDSEQSGDSDSATSGDSDSAEILDTDSTVPNDSDSCAVLQDRRVKLLLMMDQSASLQITDPTDKRLLSADLLAADMLSLPNVEFGSLGFSQKCRPTAFTSNWDDVSASLPPQGGMYGSATDYQGAFATVIDMLESDMLSTSPEVRLQTSYAVVLISGGGPEPVCTAGCSDEDVPPDALYGVCNYQGEIPDDVYVDMGPPCPDYNQHDQIIHKVRQIMSLKELYAVGDLTIDAVGIVGEDTPQVIYKKIDEPLMQMIAEEGNGSVQMVRVLEEQNFLRFIYEAFESPCNAAH